MDFLHILAEFRTPFGEQFFQFVTYFGQEVIIIAVICTLYWCVDKRFAYQMGFTYFLAGLCVQTLKITFRIPRPWVLDPEFPPGRERCSGCDRLFLPKRTYPGWYLSVCPIYVP